MSSPQAEASSSETGDTSPTAENGSTSPATELAAAEPVQQPPRPVKRSWDQVEDPTGKQTAAAPAPVVVSTSTQLTFPQLEALQHAKKFCAEQTAAFKASQMARQQAALGPQLQRMMMVQEASQRQRAFQLMCRVYVGSINFDMREDQLRQAFIPFGPIKSIDLAWDNVAMKHKGFCFVEYETPEAAQLALDQMNGVMLGGRNIKCGRPSSLPPAVPVIAQLQAEAEKFNRIYVGSIHPDLTESDIRSVFGAFGEIKSIQLAPDPVPGRHRGFAFIEFDTKQSSLDAIASMNLFDLGGQYLRVGRCLTAPTQIGTTPSTPFVPPSQAGGTNVLQAQATVVQNPLANVVTSMASGGLSGLGGIGGFAGIGGLANAGFANAALANAGLANAGLANAAAFSQMAGAGLGGAAGLAGVAGLANAANLVRAAGLGAMGLGGLGGLGAAGLGGLGAAGLGGLGAAGLGGLGGLGATGFGAAGLAGMAGAGLVNATSLANAAVAASSISAASSAATTTVTTASQLQAAQAQVAGKIGTEQSLSNEESMSISGSNARLMVMQKLQRKDESCVVVLRNMVTVDDLDEELESEVTEECSRYGRVSRVVIYQERQGEEEDADVIVKIFVCFSDHAEAQKAVKALDGRWFGGRTIGAGLYDVEKFENNELSG